MFEPHGAVLDVKLFPCLGAPGHCSCWGWLLLRLLLLGGRWAAGSDMHVPAEAEPPPLPTTVCPAALCLPCPGTALELQACLFADTGVPATPAASVH